MTQAAAKGVMKIVEYRVSYVGGDGQVGTLRPATREQAARACDEKLLETEPIFIAILSNRFGPEGEEGWVVDKCNRVGWQ